MASVAPVLALSALVYSAATVPTTAVATRVVYVANCGANTVVSYSIDSASGNARRIASSDAGPTTNFLAVDPSGLYARLTVYPAGAPSLYVIAADGRLTPVRDDTRNVRATFRDDGPREQTPCRVAWATQAVESHRWPPHVQPGLRWSRQIWDSSQETPADPIAGMP